MRFDGKCVLIVDDELAVVEALTEILAWEGLAVISAPNGVEGLRLLEVKRPEWLIADLMMPVMNGLELCKRVRALEWARNLPIVLISAAPAPSGVEPAPWNAFLRKPFDVEALLRALEDARRRAG